VTSADVEGVRALVVVDWVSALVSEVLFLIFAFAEWPALRRSRGRFPVSAGERSQDQFLPLPTRAQDPGWHQVGVTNNDQGYWDGRSWTARRRWDGAGWSDVTPGPSEPTS